MISFQKISARIQGLYIAAPLSSLAKDATQKTD
jgi:hypothetical protein